MTDKRDASGEWDRLVVAGPSQPATIGVLNELEKYTTGELDALTGELDALRRRVEALEDRPKGLEYRGVWTAGKTYEKGDTTTDGGSLWVALEATTARPGDVRPGGKAPWQLCAKRGRDGRDAGR